MSVNDPVRIQDLPAHERPRERLLSQGAEHLPSAHLLAILLRTGLRGQSALHVAEQLLGHFGSLDGLAGAPLAELRRIKGIGPDKAATLKAAFTLARRMEIGRAHV